VVRGPTGDDHDPPHTRQHLVGELRELDVIARRPVGDRLGDRVGLLVDLLEHEGVVAALLGGVGVPIDLHRLALEGRARGI
jgi:hypothetical protein